jgi:hypothetical protein
MQLTTIILLMLDGQLIVVIADLVVSSIIHDSFEQHIMLQLKIRIVLLSLLEGLI